MKVSVPFRGFDVSNNVNRKSYDQIYTQVSVPFRGFDVSNLIMNEWFRDQNLFPSPSGALMFLTLPFRGVDIQWLQTGFAGEDHIFIF